MSQTVKRQLIWFTQMWVVMIVVTTMVVGCLQVVAHSNASEARTFCGNMGAVLIVTYFDAPDAPMYMCELPNKERMPIPESVYPGEQP